MLLQNINLEKNYTDLTQKLLDIILAWRKFMLIINDITSVKTVTDNFDVTMGSFNSAKITNLVGEYILDILSRIKNLHDIGIYRFDGSISIPNINGPLTSKIQKKVIKAFIYWRLKIEICLKLKKVNFLNLTLNLNVYS